MNPKEIIGIVIAVVAVIAFIIYIAWQIKKKGLKEFAIDMIIKAEDMYAKGQNSEKMLYVIDKVKEVLATTTVGKIISIFITEENIENFIQKIFDNLKKALDYVPKKEA